MPHSYGESIHSDLFSFFNAAKNGRGTILVDRRDIVQKHSTESYGSCLVLQRCFYLLCPLEGLLG